MEFLPESVVHHICPKNHIIWLSFSEPKIYQIEWFIRLRYLHHLVFLRPEVHVVLTLSVFYLCVSANFSPSIDFASSFHLWSYIWKICPFTLFLYRRWTHSFSRLIAFKSFRVHQYGFENQLHTTNISESFHRQLRSLKTRNLPLAYFFIILSKFLDHFHTVLCTPGLNALQI